MFCSIIFACSADVLSEEEEPDADELIAAALSEARGQEGTYPNPHRPGPIDPQVHVSQCIMHETTVAARNYKVESMGISPPLRLIS